MTADRLRALADTWRGRLGLLPWDFELRIADAGEDTPGPLSEHHWMRAHRHPDHQRAMIYVASHLLDGGPPAPDGFVDVQPTDRRVERCLVHELLHLWTAPIVDGFDELEATLGEPAYAALQASLEHREEHAVDTLAMALVDAFADGARP